MGISHELGKALSLRHVIFDHQEKRDMALRLVEDG